MMGMGPPVPAARPIISLNVVIGWVLQICRACGAGGIHVRIRF